MPACRPRICASTTPKAAPLDTPSTEGSASGLRVNAWKPTPATASAPPASTATATRGSRRLSVTIASTDDASARPASARATAAGESPALPTNSAATPSASSTTASAASTLTRRRASFT